MFDYSLTAYLALFAASLLVGFSKTSVGGMVILAVPLVAIGFPAKDSIGILLPIMVFGDIMAVIYYRRSCDWSIILKFFPITAIGILIGYFLLDLINPDIFSIVLGVIITVMLVAGYLIEGKELKARQGLIYRWIVGILVGIASMMANAAGPLLGIYFLQLGLSKREFIGTRSWYFLVLNLFKVPFSISLGLITPETFALNLLFLPVIILGAVVGYMVIGMINTNVFKTIIRIAAGITAVRLIYVGITSL
ncbi:sulfite exporter TauE/SafE family protein [Yoonia sp. GPGPB17]|uniref:sulfite exporter TauE/SafE family protein n=1 Tax=Yoonia sp. GPGPB17 TaxID=3026147 RepID=UPI0030BEDD7E